MSTERNELKPGWVESDVPRCDTCGTKDQAGLHVGTPLSAIKIKVSSTEEPFITVAVAYVCRKIGCRKIYGVYPNERAREFGISKENIERCMMATGGADMFKITELQSGKMEKVKLSASLIKILSLRAPATNPGDLSAYNPNKYVEQELPT